MSRFSLDTMFIAQALMWAQRSTCTSRVKVGAVIVNTEHRIIAAGYNGAPKFEMHCDKVGCMLDSDGHCIRAIHAEENALLQCAMSTVSCKGTRLYVTHMPCIRCERLLLQAEIYEVVYMYPYGTAVDRSALMQYKQFSYSEELNELLQSVCKQVA